MLVRCGGGAAVGYYNIYGTLWSMEVHGRGR